MFQKQRRDRFFRRQLLLCPACVHLPFEEDGYHRARRWNRAEGVWGVRSKSLKKEKRELLALLACLRNCCVGWFFFFFLASVNFWRDDSFLCVGNVCPPGIFTSCAGGSSQHFAPLPCITVLAVWSWQVCGQPSYCLSFITSGGTAQKPHVL